MAAPAWLTERPIAHRGLHDPAEGIIENSPSAAAAAASAGYGMEVDLQLTVDGEAMVHHDDALGRLINGSGRLRAMESVELRRLRYRGSADRMMTLSDLCEIVAGRVPLILELKSQYDGNTELVNRARTVLQSYSGPVALMSFDPVHVRALRERAPNLVRGIIAERRYDHGEWLAVPTAQRAEMRHLRHFFRTRPDFVAYSFRDLPAVEPTLARRLFGCPILTWTVRSPGDAALAHKVADQIIFEGFRPPLPGPS